MWKVFTLLSIDYYTVLYRAIAEDGTTLKYYVLQYGQDLIQSC